MFTLVLALAASATAAGVGGGSSGSNISGKYGKLKAYVPATLISSIEQNPTQSFDVIVQGDRREKSHGLIEKILANKSGSSSERVGTGSVRREFSSIVGGRMTLTGWQILLLAKLGLAQSVLPNETVKRTGLELPLYSKQLWAYETGAPVNWLSNSPKTPTIAVVDSGIDATRDDLKGRVLGQVNLASLGPNSPGDGQGHGTFVAGIAAGSAKGYAGASPKSKIMSLDVMADNGESTVADVIAACDWILANKSAYNIRVANLSLHAVNPASVLFDPLDAAVERLWLNGVVVVAASGNYAENGANSGVPFAPGNDPFIITVGASDIGSDLRLSDDVAAPWSAWGYTADGFMKPDLSAPGRYMVGPVSPGATLYSQRHESVVAPGYMQLSGTSFAAPVVAAAAAAVLGQHPDWTPDQVKGALMLSAQGTPAAVKGSLGVGSVNIAAARAVTNPPNPNAGLNRFVSSATDGSKVFDAAAWQSAALSSAAWNSAAWSSAAWASAAWSSAAWSSAAWASAAWSSAAWSSAAWGSAAWADAAWADAAWSSAAWADNADDDPSVGAEPIAISDEAQDSILAELGIVNPDCDPLVSECTAPAGSTP